MNLPEWPKPPTDRDANAVWMAYYFAATADAALARMEALVEWVVHDSACGLWVYKEGMDPHLRSESECTCGLSELLAACERKGER